MNTKYILYLIPALLLSGCLGQNRKPAADKPFEHPIDFREEIERLIAEDVKLIKEVKTNGETDRVTLSLDSTGWAKELQSFMEASEFNVPSAAHKFSNDSVYYPLSDLTEYRYIADDTSGNIKEAVVVMRKGKVEEMRFTLGITTPAYSFSRKLLYRPRIGYSISSVLNVKMLFAEKFDVKAVFASEETPLELQFDIGESRLPVRAYRSGEQLEITNGSDRITLSAEPYNDSLKAEFPVFLSELIFAEKNGLIEGEWANYDRGKNYRIPFTSDYAFPRYGESGHDRSGRFKTVIKNGKKETRAVGEFEQIGPRLYGTFMTATGDYRHLEGEVAGDSFYLSTLDGAFAYLFEGRFLSHDELEGVYYSGNHYRADFTGVRDEKADLPDAETLTTLRPGYKHIEFSFSDTAGNRISSSDERFKDKVLLITVMGTWCPNCKDEAVFLKELHEKYADKGLEIVALAFERSTEFEDAARSVKKAVRDLELPYPVLITGKTPKQAGEALPALNRVMSFPTLIVIDRDKRVRKIHTGFKGPATGEPYREFKREMNAFIKELTNDGGGSER